MLADLQPQSRLTDYHTTTTHKALIHTATTMDSSTASRTVVVGLEEGLHLTPLRALTLLAETFNSDISIQKGELVVDAKSMFDLMTLMAEFGTQLVLTAKGTDASEAIKALGQLFDSNFRPV